MKIHTSLKPTSAQFIWSDVKNTSFFFFCPQWEDAVIIPILIQDVSCCFSSVTQSCPTLCDPHEPQHAKPPCPSTTPGVYPNPCPLSRWCHPAISSSVVPFSSCPQSFPASGSFPMSQLFASGGQSIDWSFSFNISPSSEHPGLISFRMDWLDLLAVQGTLKSFLQHHCSKASILLRSAFFIVQLSHPYMTTEKTIALTRWTFVDKITSLLFNMLSMLVMTFLPRGKRLLISWLQSPSAVITHTLIPSCQWVLTLTVAPLLRRKTSLIGITKQQARLSLKKLVFRIIPKGMRVELHKSAAYSQPPSETYFYTGEIRGKQILISRGGEDKSQSGSLKPER